jgi:hypothetical protein
MNVYEARSDEFSGGVNFFCGFTNDCGCNLHNASVRYGYVSNA